MEKGDKGSMLTRMGVSGWMFLLVPAYPSCPGQTAVKRLLLLLLLFQMSSALQPQHDQHSRPSCKILIDSLSVIQFLISIGLHVPSVLWRCWLGGRKGIRPVKNWVMRCWLGYLSGARCRLAYGPADATATHCLLLQWNPDWFYLSGTGSPG